MSTIVDNYMNILHANCFEKSLEFLTQKLISKEDIIDNVDSFNKLFPMEEIFFENLYIFPDLTHYLEMLFTLDIFNEDKYLRLKKFSFINLCMNGGYSLRFNGDIKLYNNVYNFILTNYNESLLNDLILGGSHINLSTTNYFTDLEYFLLAQRERNNYNILSSLFCSVDNYREIVYDKLILFHASIDINTNFSTLIQLVTSSISNSKLFFSQKSIEDYLANGNNNIISKRDIKLMDVFDYALANTYITKRQHNFFSKAIINSKL